MAPRTLFQRALDFNARKVTSRFRLPYGDNFYARRWLAETRLDINQMAFHVDPARLGGPGFRTVQISDLHLGTYVSNEQLMWLSERLKTLEPDLLFITGDFVNRSYREALPAREGLRALSAVAPTYGVLGNHDFWHGPDKLTRILNESGVRILRNEHLQIDMAGTSLMLAGVDDWKTGHDDLEQTVTAMPKGDHIRILLSHCPDLLHPAADLGFDLVLAGHTHGAQIRVPVLGSMVNKLMHGEFERGWMKKNSTSLYINRGLGVVFVPFRYGSDAEVTVLDVMAEPVASSDDGEKLGALAFAGA